MRTIIIAISYLIIILISLPLLLIELVIRHFSPKTAAAFALQVVHVVFRYCMFVSGCKKTVVGLENIPRDTPVMFAANHRGFYDIILTYSELGSIHKQTAFISKKEIKKFPIIAQWMYFLNCLFLDRDDIKQSLQVILTAISLVKDGYSIYIAPEGTRNPTDTLLPFKEGSMKIATKGKVPIVPVCLLNTENILESKLPWITKGPIYLEFGKPIDVNTLDPEDKKHLGAYVQKIVQSMYDNAKAHWNGSL